MIGRSLKLACSFSLLLSSVTPFCFGPSPAFPPIGSLVDHPISLDTLVSIQNEIESIIAQPQYDRSSISIELTNSEHTLWQYYHTARDRDESRHGAEVVDASSMYRVASITKVFTVLGIIQLHAAGNLSIDHSIQEYVSGLNGSLPWKDITLRSLASQLSGIPREFAQGDLYTILSNPGDYGLPPVDSEKLDLPDCDSYSQFLNPCTEKDLVREVRKMKPLFPPNQQSTYSNVAFGLLGLVIANVSGMKYEEYITKNILNEFNMTYASFEKPSDSLAVLAKGESWYWDVVEGVQNPMGGLYASSGSMSKFLRYVLTHYNGLTPALNWFQPASYGTGAANFYGMPWEIYRSTSILPSTSRPVTFITKGGGLPSYITLISLMPEYDLGLTIFTCGNTLLLDRLRKVVTLAIVKAAEKTAQNYLEDTYAGTYRAEHLNSTLTLAVSPQKGLHFTELVSNGTLLIKDTSIKYNMVHSMHTTHEYFHPMDEVLPNFRLQLVPTLLFSNQKKLRGEQWRAVVTSDDLGTDDRLEPWDDSCVTDIDVLLYAGKPVYEFVFWNQTSDGSFDEIELSGFRVKMKRVSDVTGKLLVQT